jgi:hypothetical protein
MIRQVLKTFVIRHNNALQKTQFARHMSSSVNAKANFQNSTVEIVTKKSSTAVKHEFPFVWLRDNCKVSG